MTQQRQREHVVIGLACGCPGTVACCMRCRRRRAGGPQISVSKQIKSPRAGLRSVVIKPTSNSRDLLAARAALAAMPAGDGRNGPACFALRMAQEQPCMTGYADVDRQPMKDALSGATRTELQFTEVPRDGRLNAHADTGTTPAPSLAPSLQQHASAVRARQRLSAAVAVVDRR